MKIFNSKDDACLPLTLSAMDTHYPCVSHFAKLSAGSFLGSFSASTIYGVVVTGSLRFRGSVVNEGMAFAIPQHYEGKEEICAGATGADVWFVVRVGFMSPFVTSEIEDQGRLTYIDGCTDSLLVYPPRKGDGSLSSLTFPNNIEQSYHTHPSVRLGYVYSGSGFADFVGNGEHQTKELEAGDFFLLPVHERHRFRTGPSNGMTVIAYHPDGDWGPEDHNHVMINRTYRDS